MELTTHVKLRKPKTKLFMMSKIQNLNGTHNNYLSVKDTNRVVYDVKDTKFEWNSQHSPSILSRILGCL